MIGLSLDACNLSRRSGVNRLVACFLLICVFLAGAVHAAEHRVTTSGSCAISGITAEQAQALALRRARSAAMEQAAGVSVSSSTIVTDGRLAGDFIKSFSRGYITSETITWEPVGSYLPDPSKPPIIEYRVKLDAVVDVPDVKRPILELHAELNQHVFRAHKDKLAVTARTAAPARVLSSTSLPTIKWSCCIPMPVIRLCRPAMGIA